MTDIPAYSVASGGCQEHNLMDSIPEEDRASLLPIIKLAFPFLKCQTLDAMPSCDEDDNKNFESRPRSDSHEFKQVPHSFTPIANSHNKSGRVETETVCKLERNKEDEHESKPGILDWDCLQHLIRPSEGNLCHDKNVTQSSLQEIQRINQMRELQYNFILSPVQHNKLLPSSDCPGEVRNAASHLAKVSIPRVKLEEPFSSHGTDTDASSNITNDKLSLSLASLESGTSHSGHTNMVKMHPLNQSSARTPVIKHSLDEEHGLVTVAKLNNPSKDTECGITRSTECIKVVEQSQTKDLESLPFVFITKSTTSGSLLLIPPSQLHGLPDRCSPDHLDLNDCLEREAFMDLSCGVKTLATNNRNSEHLESGSKVTLTCTTNCDRELNSGHSSTINVDECTRENQVLLSCPGINANEQKPERCRRSNGKQWRCSRDATPGLFYCELHHDYQKKIKTKESSSIDKTFTPLAKGQKLEDPVRVVEDVKDMASVSTGQKRQLDMSRCRRNDGKLWQCSKPAINGSIYCEHHHQRRHKKTKVDDEGKKENSEFMVAQGQKTVISVQKNNECISAVNIKHAPADGDVTKADQNHFKMCSTGDRHAAGWSQAADMQMIHKINAVDSCGNGEIPHVHNHGRMQGFQSAVGSALDTGATFFNVNHNIRTDEAMSNIDTHRQMATSTLVTSNIGNNGRAGQPNQSKEGQRCHRKDGKKWQCSQLCKPGFSYCEHHLGRTRNKGKAINGGTQNMYVSGGSIKVNEHDQIDQEALSGDKHNKVVKVHQDDNWLVVSDVNMKRCQRKDGKGWQCSQNTKAGFIYCEHHIGYQSKRRLTKEKKGEQHEASPSVFDHSSGTVTCVSPCNNADNQQTSAVTNEQSGESPFYMTDVKHENFIVYEKDTVSNMKHGSWKIYDENPISNEKNDSITYETNPISSAKHDSMRMYEENSISNVKNENVLRRNEGNENSNSKQVCALTSLSAVKKENPFSNVKHETLRRCDGNAISNPKQVCASTSSSGIKEENPFSNVKHEILRRSEGNAISNTKQICPSTSFSAVKEHNPFLRDYGENKLPDVKEKVSASINYDIIKQENLRNYKEMQFGSSSVGTIDCTSVGGDSFQKQCTSMFSEQLFDRFAFPAAPYLDTGQGSIQKQEMDYQPLRRSAEDIVGVPNVYSPSHFFSLQDIQNRGMGNGYKILPSNNMFHGNNHETEPLYSLDQTRLDSSSYPLPADNFENSGMCNLDQTRLGAMKYPSHSMELFKDPKSTPLTEAVKVKLWSGMLTMGCARDG